MYNNTFHCRLKPEIYRLKPVTCRPAQEDSRHEPVTDCRPEPPCVVTDIPKRAKESSRQVNTSLKAKQTELLCWGVMF